MVELFTAAGFTSGPRTWSRSGSGCHQPKAPHAGTRWTNLLLRAGPNPVGGFAAARGCAPTLRHDGPDATASRSFRIAPIPRGNTIGSNAEIGPWHTKPEGLLQRASVEHGQATLMASGSTGTAHDGWLGHPLSLVGSQIYRVCCPIERSHAVRLAPPTTAELRPAP